GSGQAAWAGPGSVWRVIPSPCPLPGGERVRPVGPVSAAPPGIVTGLTGLTFYVLLRSRNTVRTLMRNRRVLGQRRARVAVLAARFAHLFQRWRWHQAITTRADQVLFPHLFQRLTDQRPVLRIVITQQRFMQTALFIPFRHHH